MDDIERLYEHQTIMAVSIYSFLDNLLAALRSRPSSPPVPQIQMQPGGYPEDLFLYLSEKDKEELQCSICYSILRKPHQCQNNHLFCYSCVYVWSHTPGGGHDRCPMCRADGLYAENSSVTERLNKKRVKCTNEECNWRGYLRDYDEHKHRQYDASEIDVPSVELPIIPQSLCTNTMTTSALLRKVATDSSSDPPATQSQQTETRPANNNRTGRVPARRQTVTDINTTRRPIRRPEPVSRRASGPETTTRTGGGNNSFSRPGMIPRPPTTPRPPNSRSVRTGAGTVARRASQSRPPPETVPSTGNNQSSEQNSESTETQATSSTTNAATETVTPATSESTATEPSPQGATAAIETSTASVSSATEPPSGETTRIAGLEYRRLANPQPHRPNPVTDRLVHGRDQLFLLMTLMSYELEERRRAIEEFQSMSAERERVRLQQLSEVQTLNRRLTLVTNNLSRLLDGRSSTQTPRFRAGVNNANSGPRSRFNATSQDSSDSDDGLPHRFL